MTVGDRDVVINWIGAAADFQANGSMKFLIFDHGDAEELVYASAPKAFTDDGMSWKVSGPMVFVLRAGRTYDIAGTTDVDAGYPYDVAVESTGGLTTTNQNPNLNNYGAPEVDRQSGADCGIRLFTRP